MKKLFLSFAIILLFVFVANAQKLSECKWEAWGLNFSVPENMNVVQNTEDTFEVDNDAFNITMVVDKASNNTDGEAIGEMLVKYAQAQGLDVANAETQQFSGEGFEGICIEGNRKDDCGCYAILYSEVKDALVFVAITYGSGLEETANNIVNSFAFK